MLIPLNQIRQIYHTMLNAALEKENRGCTMYIFVSNDPDSLCALRIFTVSLDEFTYPLKCANNRTLTYVLSVNFAPRRGEVRDDARFLDHAPATGDSRSPVHV